MRKRGGVDVALSSALVAVAILTNCVNAQGKDDKQINLYIMVLFQMKETSGW